MLPVCRSVLNTSTNTVVKTIRVGSTPTGVAITPNGKYVYVTNGGSNTVSMINASTNTVLRTISVGRSPVGVAITPNGRYVYVNNEISKKISVIDTSTNTVVKTIVVGSSPVGEELASLLTATTCSWPDTPPACV